MEEAQFDDDEGVSEGSLGGGTLSPRDDPGACSWRIGQFCFGETSASALFAEAQELIANGNHVGLEFGDGQEALFGFIDAGWRVEFLDDFGDQGGEGFVIFAFVGGLFRFWSEFILCFVELGADIAVHGLPTFDAFDGRLWWIMDGIEVFRETGIYFFVDFVPCDEDEIFGE